MIPRPDYNTCAQVLRARWYDPATGRFTQVDPFAGVLSLPGTQQPYAYGLNNPLRYTDPNGESVLLTTLGIIGGSALVAGVGELLFNQLPAIVNHYGGYQGVLKAVRCVGFDSILGMIDGGAVVGAMTNVIVAGLVAAAAVWAIPIVIAGLPLSGLGTVGVSLGLHWLYGGIAGFMGGMMGAMVKAAINRQPVVYTMKDVQADFRWGSRFSALGAILGHLVNQVVITQFRQEATNIATVMSQGGVPASSSELGRILKLAQSGTPQNTGNALLSPGTANVTVNQLGVILDVLLNDNYWKDFADFVASRW
ncbi:MAG: RHS repeat-associated core domain-containing protein [Anaerolineae bacterium]|nr:RHS repeat-associated core domain-containing protein [Anaerolineae bacterium]